MKLTKEIRAAFVRAVINDVPTVDYLQMIRRSIIAEAVSQLPPKVLAVYNDKNLSDWVKTDWNYYFSVSVSHPSCDGKPINVPVTVAAQCEEWLRLHKEQEATIRKLRESLSGAAASVTTRKALAALLPEFEKYLPVDEQQALRSVPAIANVVADFAKAGWPKAKQQQGAKA